SGLVVTSAITRAYVADKANKPVSQDRGTSAGDGQLSRRGAENLNLSGTCLSISIDMHPPARAILAKTVFPVLSSPRRSRPATSRYERVIVEWRLPGAGRVRLMHTVAVVLAGGTGERFGTSVPKQLLPFAGRPLIEHSVAAFDGAPAVDAVLVVMAASHAAQAREALAAGGYRKLAGVITGGPTRGEATPRGLEEMGNNECDVLFHDAARPPGGQPSIPACAAALPPPRAPGRGRGRALLRHDRRGRRRCHDGHATAGQPGAAADPAGLPAVGDPAGARTRRHGPAVRRPARDRRLRDRAALPAGDQRAYRAGQRAQS